MINLSKYSHYYMWRGTQKIDDDMKIPLSGETQGGFHMVNINRIKGEL